LFGRDRPPVSQIVRAVLGIRGEPRTPEIPAEGQVWRAIVDHLDRNGAQTEYVSVTDIPRTVFVKHPWSLAGGGQLQLSELIERNAVVCLADKNETISSLCITREDEAYLFPRQALDRQHIRKEHQIVSVQGDQVRDWQINGPGWAIFPYNSDLHPISL
jgi:hypothetical protein